MSTQDLTNAIAEAIYLGQDAEVKRFLNEQPRQRIGRVIQGEGPGPRRNYWPAVIRAGRQPWGCADCLAGDTARYSFESDRWLGSDGPANLCFPVLRVGVIGGIV
jgi:hypothetical protein